ncbi:MAG: primosomal protein N' [Bacteroidales bacterium]|nr:primosomal protein N' [Bacteroidales bacterium]
MPLAQTFTYRLTEQQTASACIGMRVKVPFGKQHHYTGIIVSITPHAPEGIEIKDVTELPDDAAVIRHPQYALWQWIAEYYMCPIGDVMKAALPAKLKPESGKAGIIREDFKPKTRIYVKILIPPLGTDVGVGRNTMLAEAFDKLKRSQRQQELFMKLLDMSHCLQKVDADLVPQDELFKATGYDSTVLRELIKKKLCEQQEVVVSRLDTGDDDYCNFSTEQPFPLTEIQIVAFRNICSSFKDKSVTLLHGVTSSGKTEIYIHLMREVIAQKRQVLMMVPEIALTTQLCIRLRRVFGKRMLVYHSKLNDDERAEIWNRMLTDDPVDLILGVRSSVFLPFSQLGLIIVDEEHEPSYKQQDPAPRYNGREVAIMLASRHSAKVLLGSATPSLESYYLAQQDRFGYVRLKERHAGVSLPKMSLISMRDARKNQTMNGPFTPTLIKSVNHALLEGHQAILFQNRRGFSPTVECTTCGWTPKCPRCDVSLTFHKRTSRLSCHYCGYSQSWPSACPQCQHSSFAQQGYGTERIEETISRLMPLAKPVRMDTDTTGSKSSYEKIIRDFDSKKSNVLIGTQMVSKGLDFGGVDTVGIMNADSLMNFPDFRSHERAFQLMEQVAGRAGRRVGQEGEVLIQCNEPHHPLLQQVIAHDYEAMAEMQLADRKKYFYPPFSRLIMIYMKGRYEDRLDALAARYASVLRKAFGERVLGPEAPGIARIKNMFIRQIMLKIEREASTQMVRQYLNSIQITMMNDDHEFSKIVFYYDVDPM